MNSPSLLISLGLVLLSPALVLAQDAGDANSDNLSNAGADSVAGASGGQGGAFNLSRGAMIGIIVSATLVGVFGLGSAALFYVAKKRQWEIRKSLRKSARRIHSTLTTPRSATFPRNQRGVQQIRGDRPVQVKDLEKGLAKPKVTTTIKAAESPPRSEHELGAGLSGWARKASH